MYTKAKVCLLLTGVIGLTGCQKAIKLQPKQSVSIEYGEKYNKTLRDYLVLDDLTEEEIENVLNKSTITIENFNKDKVELGNYKVKIDFGGQQYQSLLEVKDTQAPIFNDVSDIYVEYGDKTYDFSKRIKAKDLQDIKYTFDKSKINFNKTGKYKLIVTATDLSHNKTTSQFDVVVKEKKVTPVKKPVSQKAPSKDNGHKQDVVAKPVYKGTTGDSQLDATCDNILNSIINTSMDERQQANAIYNWVTKHIRYSGTTSINNWVSSAKKSFRTRKGNCVAFCYTSKALMTRLGLENVVVHGKNDGHLWNMVKVNCQWYHFDTTSGWGARRFLWTTQQMKDYSYQTRKELLKYNWDESQYPVTP